MGRTDVRAGVEPLVFEDGHLAVPTWPGPGPVLDADTVARARTA